MIRLNHTPAQPTRVISIFFPALIMLAAGVSSGAIAEPASAGTVSPFKTLVDPSGCIIEQITAADRDEHQVMGPSADGKLLAIASRKKGAAENDAVYTVHEVDLATGETKPLSRALTNSGPYSPDGRFIVVAQTTENGKTDILEYERATGELRPVASHEEWDWLPSYSPDGRFIVFNSYRVDGQSDIHLFERSTGTLRQLTEDPRYDAHAQFSSDGTLILYHRQQGTRDDGGYVFDLFVHDLATDQKTQLTHGDYEEGYPAWAPDDRHVVYSSDLSGKPGKPNLYVLSLDSGKTIRLTEGDWKDSYAAWSRDGKFIYFNSDRAGTKRVYRLPMDGVDCVR